MLWDENCNTATATSIFYFNITVKFVIALSLNIKNERILDETTCLKKKKSILAMNSLTSLF